MIVISSEYNENMDIWNRLTRRPDGEHIGFPVHLFLFVTAISGVAFILPPEIFSLHLSEAFRFSSEMGSVMPTILGVWMILATIANTATVLLRKKWLGASAAMMGFTGWLYVAIAYASFGHWFAFAVAAFPCMCFWGWYYLQVRKWKRWDDEQLPHE